MLIKLQLRRIFEENLEKSISSRLQLSVRFLEIFRKSDL